MDIAATRSRAWHATGHVAAVKPPRDDSQLDITVVC